MHATRPSQPELGIVIPCYDEEAVLGRLLDALRRVGERSPWPVYFLFVDDGSRDRTLEILAQACRDDARMACVSLSRNFGHQTAVTAGLRLIRGDIVGIIDADLQDAPELLLEMAVKWQEGYDVVYGVRTNRKESTVLRACYKAFYRILKRLANIDIPLDAGDFCLMDRRVVDLINRMPEHNRFIRGLRGWIGFRQWGFPYERNARAAGHTKYDLGKLFKLAFDGLISFSAVPLKLAGWLGVSASLAGFLYLIYAVVARLFFHIPPSGWTSLAVLILFFGGLQMIVLGIIGEYLGRIFDEVKNRPHFIPQQTLGWVAQDPPAVPSDG